MSRSDWTDPAMFAHMLGYEAMEFAAEYLIRNDEFIAEYARRASQAVEPGALAGPPDFAIRWGARFHDHG